MRQAVKTMSHGFSFIKSVPNEIKVSFIQSCFFWNFISMITTCIVFEGIFFITTRKKILKTLALPSTTKNNFLCLSRSSRALSGWIHSVRGLGHPWSQWQSHKWGGGCSSWVSIEGLPKKNMWQLHSENKLNREMFIVCYNLKVFYVYYLIWSWQQLFEVSVSSHFTKEETEAQRGSGTHSKRWNWCLHSGFLL